MTLKIWTNKVDRDSDLTQGKVTQSSVLIGLNLTGGVALGDKWPKVTIDVISDDKPADSFLSGPLLIVSRRLSDLISKHTQTSEVEFLPIEVNYQGKSFGEYYFLNVLAIYWIEIIQYLVSLMERLIQLIELSLRKILKCRKLYFNWMLSSGYYVSMKNWLN
ncbi:TPA: hypothetical protein ACPJ1A_003894 [Vibrio diabolicus]